MRKNRENFARCWLLNVFAKLNPFTAFSVL